MTTAVAERARLIGTPAAPSDLHDRHAELREQERRREAARIAAEAELAREAERAELFGRWGLDRYAPRPQQGAPAPLGIARARAPVQGADGGPVPSTTCP
ncbi:hypothetical protein ACFUV2_34280 [Streptomyces pilosus]|uniref:hypothetical protein n=1 Tax=Streptomyces pilosus TaxID=28893 RepID=UPI0036345C00